MFHIVSVTSLNFIEMICIILYYKRITPFLLLHYLLIILLIYNTAYIIKLIGIFHYKIININTHIKYITYKIKYKNEKKF